MAWLALPIIILFLSSFILPFTYWPEMLNWPHFMNFGLLPYKDFAIIHTPLLPYLLLISYKILGFTPLTLHMFGTFLLCLTALLVELVVKNLTKSTSHAVLAGFISGFLMLAFSGNHVWFESLLAPFLVGTFWCQITYLKNQKPKYLILSGVFMGFSLLTKQTAAYLFPAFIIFALFLYRKNKSIKKTVAASLYFIISLFSILALFLLALQFGSILPNFFDWGVKFVFLKPFAASSQDSYLLLPTLKQFIVLLPFIILSLLIFLKEKKFVITYAFCWMLLSCLLSFPRFDYFHLIPSVVFFSIILTVGKPNIVYVLIAIFFAALILIKNLVYSHTFLEQNNLDIAAHIKKNYPHKSLFVLNDPEQIYFLTNKTPTVLPWIPQLPWYLEHYGDKILTDFQKNKPEVILQTPYLKKSVDGLGAFQPKKLVNFIKDNYTIAHRFDNDVVIWLKNDR